jgi:hypothetical protein
MITRNLPVGKGRKADNLTAICEQTVLRKCGSLDVSTACDRDSFTLLRELSLYSDQVTGSMSEE